MSCLVLIHCYLEKNLFWSYKLLYYCHCLGLYIELRLLLHLAVFTVCAVADFRLLSEKSDTELGC